MPSLTAVALLVTATGAQGNVPDPSDPGDFDTVISLPGDENLFNGFVERGVAGIPARTQLNISDGADLPSLEIFVGTDSEVNISSGNIGYDDGVLFLTRSKANISGGSVGFDAGLYARDSTVNISGGSVGRVQGIAAFNSTVNISGGTFGDRFFVEVGSKINLRGTEFLLDGVLLDELTPGEPFTIAERGGAVLSSTLADGSPFELTLNTDLLTAVDYFDHTATLTVTLVPEPSGVLLLLLVGSGGMTHRRRYFSGRLPPWRCYCGGRS